MFKDWFITEETHKHNIKKIDIFDFDDTLVYSPCPNQAKKILAKHNAKTGEKVKINFDPNSYWENPKSLEPPIVPKPTPFIMLNHKVSVDYFNSQRDPQRLTVVMTGRSKPLRPQVKRILDDFNMHPDRLYLMSNEKPTVDSKIEQIAQLLDEFPHVQEIEIWDDKGPTRAKLIGNPMDNHLAEFKKFLNICKIKRERRDSAWGLKIKVNEVPLRDKEAAMELAHQHPDFGKSPSEKKK